MLSSGSSETEYMFQSSVESSPSPIASNAPKFGTLVPNRVFVGGISASTTEGELHALFSKYGNVRATKIISDRAGVSKGYGFVTFETEEEARRIQKEADNLILKERKLNIAPAIKKQPFARVPEDNAEQDTPLKEAPLYYDAAPMVHGGSIMFNNVPYGYHQNGLTYYAPQENPYQSHQAHPPVPFYFSAPQFYVHTAAPQYPTGQPGPYYYTSPFDPSTIPINYPLISSISLPSYPACQDSPFSAMSSSTEGSLDPMSPPFYIQEYPTEARSPQMVPYPVSLMGYPGSAPLIKIPPFSMSSERTLHGVQP